MNVNDGSELQKIITGGNNASYLIVAADYCSTASAQVLIDAGARLTRPSAPPAPQRSAAVGSSLEFQFESQLREYDEAVDKGWCQR